MQTKYEAQVIIYIYNNNIKIQIMTMYSPYIESILKDLNDSLDNEPFTVGATKTKSSIAMLKAIKTLAEYADDLEFDNTSMKLKLPSIHEHEQIQYETK